MIDGRCGIGDLTLFDSAGYRSRKAAQIPDYDASAHFTPLERRRLSRSDQIAIRASSEALADAGLLESGIDRDRVGIMIGAGTSDLFRNEDYLFTVRSKGMRHARPSLIVNHFISTPCDVIAGRFDLRGPKACVVSACSSSTIAIGYAGDAIRDGRIDAAICGGADALCRLTFSGFNALRLVDTEACRPFDSARNGMNIGEAAAMLVLEDLDRARRRGATIYAELAGYGVTCEAFHATAPEPEGRAIAATLRAALADAQVDASAVDHINAHGTATPENDKMEFVGISAVFGERATQIPVSSNKSMIGHTISAAGAVEAIISLLTLEHQRIPPTINYDIPDPAIPFDVVPNVARDARVTAVMSNSFGFGGQNASLILTREPI